MPLAAPPVADRIRHLRKQIGTIDPSGLQGLQGEPDARSGTGGRIPLGSAPLDGLLGGGLAVGALHEMGPAEPADLAAVTGFALAIALRAATCPTGMASDLLIWIQHRRAADAGRPYGPGLAAFGLDPARVVLVEAQDATEALHAAEEALRGGIGTILAELADDLRTADLTATRRLSLAARAGGTLALLIGHRMPQRPAAAASRWRIAAAPGPIPHQPDIAHPGDLGPPALLAELTKNRHGPAGSRWRLVWDPATRAFHAAEPAADRTDAAERHATAVPGTITHPAAAAITMLPALHSRTG